MKYQIQIAYKKGMYFYLPFVPLFNGKETFSTFKDAITRFADLQNKSKGRGSSGKLRIVRLVPTTH